MKRPLRSLLIGDVDHYPSEFIFGVQQGMAILGHWHRTVNIRQPAHVIRKVLDEVRPDIIWGHMFLWAPMYHADRWPTWAEGKADREIDDTTQFLLNTCEALRHHEGTKVVIHDGDARVATRYPHDISSAVDLALCNHTADRSAWKIPTLHWPYFAFVQKEIAAPVKEFQYDLVFAGRNPGSGIYQDRAALLHSLSACLGDRFLQLPNEQHPHTLFRTPEIAASATAVLGHGRPVVDAPGWTDVRVFQYPGAGGLLFHDDASRWLDPWTHYIPYRAADLESVVESLDWALLDPSAARHLRHVAFHYVQENHSSVVRVQQVLTALGLGL